MPNPYSSVQVCDATRMIVVTKLTHKKIIIDMYQSNYIIVSEKLFASFTGQTFPGDINNLKTLNVIPSIKIKQVNPVMVVR